MWPFFVSLLLIGAVQGIPVKENGQVPRKPSPEEEAGLVEGDMDISPPTGFRSAIKEKFLWPNGVIPYKISDKARQAYTKGHMMNLSLAMEEFHKHTCVRFVPYTDGDNYVLFSTGSGCSSNVGMIKLYKIEGTPNEPYGQRLTLGPTCTGKGTIMHEMMHALGFYHEQARWDRDDYVVIKSENIVKGSLRQFRVYNSERSNVDLGAPYDYGSLMHYSRFAFSLYDDQETIIPIKPGAGIGQRRAFSQIDIWKINRLYNCPDFKDVTLSPELHTTPAKPDFIVNPTPPTSSREEFYCSFDYTTTCGMRDDLASAFDWRVNQGGTSTEETGPDGDVSGHGEGYYAYTETSGESAGKKSYLITPYLSASPDGSCLQFYYHMYGPTIGTLRVFARDYQGKEHELFKKTGDQGNKWYMFAETFKMDQDFEIVFESTVGGHIGEIDYMQGDMAIDYVQYRQLSLYPNLGCEAMSDEELLS